MAEPSRRKRAARNREALIFNLRKAGVRRCAQLCVAVFFTAVALTAATPTPVIADIVTAENMVGGWEDSGLFTGVGFASTPGWTNEAAGQKFDASVSGLLSSLEVSVDHWQGGEPLIVSVYEAVGDFPGELFGSLTIPEALVQHNVFDGLSVFDLSGMAVSLQAGTSYVLTFHTNTALPLDLRYRALRTAPNANSFGYAPMYSQHGTDWHSALSPDEIGVRVWVAVPETAAALSALIGFAVVLTAGRGRRVLPA